MTYRRYPNQNRIPVRDRIYLDDYADQLKDDSDSLIGSVGDSVKLLKNYKVPMHDIDHVGDKTPKGRHGGRRQLQPTIISKPQDIYARGGEKIFRPQFDNTIIIPAIVDLKPSDEVRMLYGFLENDAGIVSIARKFLDYRGIEIDPSKDYFGIYGAVYKIRVSDDGEGGYLDTSHVYTYTVKKDF